MVRRQMPPRPPSIWAVLVVFGAAMLAAIERPHPLFFDFNVRWLLARAAKLMSMTVSTVVNFPQAMAVKLLPTLMAGDGNPQTRKITISVTVISTSSSTHSRTSTRSRGSSSSK